jgi:hypothetical protein
MPIEPITGGAASVGRRPRPESAEPRLDDIAFAVAPLTAADWKQIDERLAGRFNGFFVSRLMGAALPWRSRRHFNALSLFELDPAIDRIEIMPERVMFVVDGRTRDYTPHFRLRSGAEVTVVDVLRRGQESNPARAAVTAVLEEIYARRGIRYHALHEARVAAQPRLGNARAVLACRGFDPPPEAEMAVVETLGERRRHTVGSLAERLQTTVGVKDTVFALATRRKVRLDLWAPRHADMAVELLSWRGLQ